ncbi:MAG: hypothetical protein ACLR2E_02685 [Lachnospiraceae bacterium]
MSGKKYYFRKPDTQPQVS